MESKVQQLLSSNKSLLKVNQQNESVISELRRKVKTSNQKARRSRYTVQQLRKAAIAYSNNSIGIEISTLSEPEKWEALLKLAHERIDKEVDLCNEAKMMTEDERFEEKETLKAVFEAGYKNLGKFNKSGDKRGINTKYSPRLIHLALSLVSKISQSAYETLRLTRKDLPTYDFLYKYRKKVILIISSYYDNID